MDTYIQLCIDVIRHRIHVLLSKTEEDQEDKYQILHELSKIREELDDLNYLLTMF